jgi:hypothetical protein
MVTGSTRAGLLMSLFMSTPFRFVVAITARVKVNTTRITATGSAL